MAKTSTKHPYAAIEHRVIDSPAYADLSHSACRLLTILTRQLTKDNNGNLQATFAYCNPRGIGSEHTLRDAIADLISHGFIYRTRAAGAQKAWARYAVTWLSVRKMEGLFMDVFVPCAWRNWQPEKKSVPQKVQGQTGRKCSLPTEKPAESAGNRGAESADYELVTNIHSVAPYPAQAIEQAEPDEHGDEYQRIHDADQTAGQWNETAGEFIHPATRTKTRPPEVERVRRLLHGM